MSLSSQSAVNYYRDIWATVLRHATRGQLFASSGRDDIDLVPTEISTPEALLSGGDHRIGLFMADPSALLLRIRPGEGADIATAATTALNLAEQVSADGGVPVPLTDGFGGLLVLARISGDVDAAAQRYAAGIAGRAPELATLDAAQADGRCVVQTRWSTSSAKPAATSMIAASASPVPYCLVLGPRGPTPVIPLHLDEVAAVAAGMPLELDADDVRVRLATRGDLAAALLDVGTA